MIMKRHKRRRRSKARSLLAKICDAPAFHGFSLQVKAELDWFIEKMNSAGVTSYLEIGCHQGNSFHYVMSHLPTGSKGVALDSPEAYGGTKGSADMLTAVIEDLNAKGYDCRAVFGDSTNPEMIAKVASLGPFDAIFVDGDHRLPGVTADCNNYRPHARKLIAFHDIANDTIFDGERMGVSVFWGQVEGRKEQCVAPGSFLGIGILWSESAAASGQS